MIQNWPCVIVETDGTGFVRGACFPLCVREKFQPREVCIFIDG